MAFISVLKCAGTMLFFILVGYFLVKSGKASSDHAKSFSAFLLYACNPCLMISSFQAMDQSAENFRKSMIFFGVTLVLQMLFMLLLFAIFRRKYNDAKYRILTMCATLGNVGFFGLPLVTGIFPSESIVACYSTLYVTSMNIIVFTMGVFLLTQNRKYISVKAAIVNPTTLSVIAGMALYLMKFTFPEAIGDTIWLMGKFTTPLCMIIIGFRLASMSLKEVFTAKFAYQASALKLLIFPVFAYALVYFLPFLDTTAKLCVFILSATPAGAINLTLAELHQCEQKPTANAVLMTTLFSLITVPALAMLI